MRSPFEEEITPGGNRLVAGQRYTFVIIDGGFKKNCVSYNKNADYPREIKGREMETLTPEQLDIVKNSTAPTWPDGSDAPKFEDIYNFQIEEPVSGVRIGYIDPVKGYAIGGLEMKFPGGKPTKEFYTIYRAIKGNDPEDGKTIKINDILPKGGKFTAIAIRDPKNPAYSAIDKKSIQAEGFEEQGTVQEEVAGNVEPSKEMSEVAKTIMDTLVANKESWNGKPGGAILQMVGKSLLGVITNDQVMEGWRDVKAKVLDNQGNLRVA